MSQNEDRTTLADVARHAGVSAASVSRVLNDTGPVSESMRRRVEASLDALEYEHVPHRTNARARTRQLAVIIADIRNPFFTEVLWGIEEEADDAGLHLNLFITMEDIGKEQRALDTIVDQGLDGVILSGSRVDADRLVSFRNKYDVPTVVLNRQIKHPNVACILVDLERTAYRAAQHLLNLNHSRIAYLAGPSASESSQFRRRGVERALRERDLMLRRERCPSSFPNIEGGFQAMTSLLAQPADQRPTAVIAYNDMMALGALAAIRTHNLRVPDDISIVGFDDIAIAAHANPPLTTIAQPKYKMGKLAVRTLLHMQTGEPIPSDGYILLESPLIVRESTAVCRYA